MKLSFSREVAVSVLIVAAVLVSGCNSKTAPNYSAELTDTELVSLGNPAHIDWISATHSDMYRIGEMPSGEETLDISYFADNRSSSVTIKPKTLWNLTQYPDHNVAFDIGNKSDVSLQLWVSTFDNDGGYDRRSVTLPANFSGTVFFPITGEGVREVSGIWGVPNLWPTPQGELHMDWMDKGRNSANSNAITSIRFASFGLLSDREIAVSNIRLRPNPQRDNNWSQGLVDKFGQSTRENMPLRVHSEEELKAAADAELIHLQETEALADRSKHGGYKDGPKLEGTGYFRKAKVDGKWWLVDPEGYLFFSHGPANVRMSNMTTFTGVDFKDDSVRYVDPEAVTPEDSMGIIKVSDDTRKTRFIASELRHKLFEWLPSYDDRLEEHYSYRRSTLHGPVPHGETFSFYRANLERRYGEQNPESYIRKWEEVTLDRMKAWGFTSFGNWVDPAFYPNEQVPYFANGWIIGDFKTLKPKEKIWGDIPDVFDPVFEERTRATISVIAEEVQGSPWCVGIFIDNEKSWGATTGSVEARYNIILDALSRSAEDSPAKAVFMAFLKDKHTTIGALNLSWETNIADWETLSKGISFNQFSDPQIADISKMLEMLGNQYFKVIHDTLEEYLPNHLYMGVRMATWGMPEEVVKGAVKYSDVLSFNIYEEGLYSADWEFLKELDMPAVIGEFHIGATSDSGMYHPGLISAVDQEDRVRMYKAFMQSVTENSNLVGAHWFQYIDEPLTGRAYDGENAAIGFVNVADIPYPGMTQAALDINRNLYPMRYKK